MFNINIDVTLTLCMFSKGSVAIERVLKGLLPVDVKYVTDVYEIHNQNIYN